MSKSAIKIEKVSKYLGKHHILKRVSLEVKSGDIYGFLGPNGAGKTTLLKCIMGILEIDDGEISILGDDKFGVNTKRQIGFMPENTYLYKYLKGREFLEFNGKFFDIPKDELSKKIDELLDKVGLSHAGNKYLGEYSKGMLQRIGLAQSIINDPKILFLDEPMSGLDPIGRKTIKDLLIELNKNGTTIFFNTHILADVQEICNKFSIIHHGEIIVRDMLMSEIEVNLEDYFIEKINR